MRPAPINTSQAPTRCPVHLLLYPFGFWPVNTWKQFYSSSAHTPHNPSGMAYIYQLLVICMTSRSCGVPCTTVVLHRYHVFGCRFVRDMAGQLCRKIHSNAASLSWIATREPLYDYGVIWVYGRFFVDVAGYW